ncbi:MAG: hypothetical protein OXC40_04790 [Proteobacteria bacterium]|nr:hypothetical protein [Pseudomonadota bacterium]
MIKNRLVTKVCFCLVSTAIIIPNLAKAQPEVKQTPTKQKTLSILNGLIREKVGRKKRHDSAVAALVKETVFSSIEQSYPFCHQELGLSLAKFALFSATVYGYLKEDSQSIVGSCLVVQKYRFFRNARGNPIVSGTLQQSKSSHTIQLIEDEFWQNHQEKKQSDSASDTAVPNSWRFARLPQSLSVLVNTKTRVMMTISEDIKQEGFSKIGSYYIYPKVTQKN